jgi:signal transduction histidine kinase
MKYLQELERFNKISMCMRYVTLGYIAFLEYYLYHLSNTIVLERAAYVMYVVLYVHIRIIQYFTTSKAKRESKQFFFVTYVLDLMALAGGIVVYGMYPITVLIFALMFLSIGFMFDKLFFMTSIFVGMLCYYFSVIILMLFRQDIILIFDNVQFTTLVYLIFVPMYLMAYIIMIQYIKYAILYRDEIVAMQNKLKSDFLATAAHQLRTPLSSMKWMLEMLIEGDLGETSDKQKEYIQKGRAGVDTMIQLVDDLLRIVRVEEGDFSYRFEPISMSIFMNNVLEQIHHELNKKHIQIIINQPETDVRAEIDINQMAYVLVNLLSNAIKYSGYQKTIFFEWQIKDTNLYISVRDQGIGIPIAEQSKIFQKFFRASNVSLTEQGSTGLGLFISNKIVQAHQGRIWFESTEGEGTIFYISLPLRQNSKEMVE